MQTQSQLFVKYRRIVCTSIKRSFTVRIHFPPLNTTKQEQFHSNRWRTTACRPCSGGDRKRRGKRRGIKSRRAASPSPTGIKESRDAQRAPRSSSPRQVSAVTSNGENGEKGWSRGNLRTPGDNFNSLFVPPDRSHGTRRSSRRERGDLRFLKLLTRFFDFNYSFNIF